MGNIRKASVEAMKAVKNAKQAPTISEETVNEIKEAHRRFTQKSKSQPKWESIVNRRQTQGEERQTYTYMEKRPHSRLSGKKLVAWLYVSLVAILLIIAGVGFWKKANPNAEADTSSPIISSNGQLTTEFRLPVRLLCEGDMVGFPITMDITIDQDRRISGTYTNVKYGIDFTLTGWWYKDNTLNMTAKNTGTTCYFHLKPEDGNLITGYGQANRNGKKKSVCMTFKKQAANVSPSAHARPSESYDLKRYHNSRFGFNIAYPASFSTTQESTNGDGAILMRDEDTYLRAYGEDNYWNETLKERFESKKADYPSVVYSRLKNNWFVISGYLEDGRIFYHKTVQKGDSFVTAILCFRSGEKEYFSPIITEIFGKFPK